MPRQGLSLDPGLSGRSATACAKPHQQRWLDPDRSRTFAAMAKAKQAKPAVTVGYKTLVGLLGKSPKDPAVEAVLAKAGKVSVKSDFIVAKEAGFDFSLGQPEGAKRNAPKVLRTLFLFADGSDGHREFGD